MKKFLSSLISLALTVSPLSSVGATPTNPAPKVPDFVREVTPPPGLGFVESYYKGETSKPVVLIQDLHANYGVQKKIIGILEHLQPKVAQAGRSMVIGIEGAWGDIDLAFIRSEARAVREAVGEFLMKQAEISGMEHFAAMSEQPIKLVGIDDPQDYILHLELYRKSLAARLKLAGKVETLRHAVAQSRGKATRAIKRIWEIEEAYQQGKIGLPELASRLNVPRIDNYGQAEALLYQRKVELAEKEGGKKSFFLKNLVTADQNLSLLSRLFRQRLTLEEVQFVAKKLPEMLAVIQALLPGEDMEEWKETVRAAIDYYAVALMRDKPLSEHAYQLAQQNPGTSVVVVTGGFHTAGIASLLRQRKVSHLVIAPLVGSHTAEDEMLYIRRILGEPVSDTEITAAARASVQSRTLAKQGAYAYEVVKGWVGRSVLPLFRPATRVAATSPARDLLPVRTSHYGSAGRSITIPTGASESTLDTVWNKIQNRSLYRDVDYEQLEQLLNRWSFSHDVPRIMYAGREVEAWLIENIAAFRRAPIPKNEPLAIRLIHPRVIEIRPEQEVLKGRVSVVLTEGQMYIDINASIANDNGGVKFKEAFQSVMQAYQIDENSLRQTLKERLGANAFHLEFRNDDALEETFFGPHGVEPTIVLDATLLDEGNEGLLFLALAKGISNLLYDRGEMKTMPPFLVGAVREKGIAWVRDVVRQAAWQGMGTLYPGAKYLMDAVGELIGRFSGIEDMSFAQQADLLVGNMPVVEDIVRRYLSQVDSDRAVPGFRHTPDGYERDLLPIFKNVNVTGTPGLLSRFARVLAAPWNRLSDRLNPKQKITFEQAMQWIGGAA